MINLSESEYIEKCKKINPDFDYSDLNYKDAIKGFVTPICKKHGLFSFNIRGLYKKKIKCPVCKKEERIQHFIEKAKQIHGDKYEYDISTYVTTHNPMRIICSIHGEFWQAPGDHLKGWGCSKCSRKHKPTTEEWIEKAAPIYDFKYDYSKVEYVDNKTNVIVVCPLHGEFSTIPNNHIKGIGGCPTCKFINLSKRLAKTTEEFIEECKIVYKDKDYSYEYVNYKTNKIPITITCAKHGNFETTPSNFLNGFGCPSCGRTSQGLLYERIMNSFPDIKFSLETRTLWLGLQRFDIYCYKYNFAIEYDGELHFYPIEVFGGEEKFKQTLEYDRIKNLKCIDNHCKLFRVGYKYSKLDYVILVDNIKSYINDPINYIPNLQGSTKIIVI